MDNCKLIKRKFIDYIDVIVKNKKISHAYLVEVDDIKNDFSYVLLFIKMILFNKLSSELEEIDSVVINQIDNNNYPDLKIIEPDGTFIKKSQLLELQKDFVNTSLLNGKRFYVINNAEMLNSSSANTMLKFLEEPVEDVIAILVTTNKYLVIDTILSRCQVLTLKENEFNFEKNEYLLELICCIVNPKSFFIQYRYFLEKILFDKSTCKDIFIKIEQILISYLDFYYRNIDNFDTEICVILRKADPKILLNYLSLIEKELFKLNYNVNYKLWLDSLFAKMIEIGG